MQFQEVDFRKKIHQYRDKIKESKIDYRDSIERSE